jgi:mycothiol synthase
MTELAASLPDVLSVRGLTFRPFDPDRDYEALVALMADANVEDRINEIPTVESTRVEFEHLGEFDPRRDVLLAEIDGRLVAAAWTHVRTRNRMAVHHVDGWVLPDWRRRGLGRALLAWTQARGRDVARVDGRTGERAFMAWPEDTQPGAIALYEGDGFRAVRYGFNMVRDLRQPIPDRTLPDGLEVRDVLAADHRRIWDADAEAFRDHWGSPERTEIDFVRWFADPDLDTDRWQVAWDGDQVAGCVMTFVYPSDNERLGISRGWLQHISVRRPWRRRGVASALIARSLRDLRDHGIAEAALGVDAENASGALQLYEALGFRRESMHIAYQKVFVAD